MDAKPRAFDAKIFAADADHPGGWGTVLVAGMRFGGGTMTVDTDQDGLGAPNNSDDHEFRSSFVVLDITNPEKAPVLMAEIADPGIGFTTSYPTAFAVRKTDNSLNQWFLAFGNGPDNQADGTSTQNGRLMVYDLNLLTWASGYDPASATNVVSANSFVGDSIAADWDLNFMADKLYVGSVSGTPANPSGNLHRLNINESNNPGSWSLEVRLATGQPVLTRPTLSVDKYQHRWVYVGTGRFLVNDDKTSDAQQTLYGFRDNPEIPASPTNSTSLPATNNLVDVSNARVSTDASTTPPFKVRGVAMLTSPNDGFDDLLAAYDARGASWKDGWFINLTAAAGEPANRIVKEGALLGGAYLQPNYTPSVNLCGGSGTSSLFGLHFKTGTAIGAASEKTIFGAHDATNVNAVTNNNDGTANNTGDSIREFVDGALPSKGLASSPSLHLGKPTSDTDCSGGLKAITQKSDGSIESTDAETPNCIRSGETSWREQYE
jgi:type IV pilus assembly protein PilY1